MSTSTSETTGKDEAKEERSLARLRRMVNKLRNGDTGGWLMSRRQHESIFGDDGLLAQRGIAGINRVQSMLGRVFAQSLDLIGFGTCSFRAMLHEQMRVFSPLYQFYACESEGGLARLCDAQPALAQIDAEALKKLCITGEFPETPVKGGLKFYLYPVQELQWVNNTLKVKESDLVPNLPADAEWANLGQVFAYVTKRMERNESLPRYIYLQHAILPGSAHRPEKSYQILIQPYEEKQITLIETPFPVSNFAGGDEGIHLRKYILRQLCDLLHLDRRHTNDYDTLSFGGDIVLWAGIVSSYDIFRNQGTGPGGLELPE